MRTKRWTVLAAAVLMGLGPAFNPLAGTIGDVNGDGVVTRSDAEIILRHTVSSIILGELERGAADVNGDGVIDAIDAILILKSAAQSGGSFWDSFRATAVVEDSAVRLSLAFSDRSQSPDEDRVTARLLDLAGEVLDEARIRLTGGPNELSGAGTPRTSRSISRARPSTFARSRSANPTMCPPPATKSPSPSPTRRGTRCSSASPRSTSSVSLPPSSPWPPSSISVPTR